MRQIEISHLGSQDVLVVRKVANRRRDRIHRPRPIGWDGAQAPAFPGELSRFDRPAQVPLDHHRVGLPCVPNIMPNWNQYLAVSNKRAHFILPDDLLSDIDALVGHRGRSAFLVEVLRREVNRRRLLDVLDSAEPAWKDEDHPELANGSAPWLRELRDQDNRIEQEKSGGAVNRRPE